MNLSAVYRAAAILQDKRPLTLKKRTSADTFSAGESFVNCRKQSPDDVTLQMLGGFGTKNPAVFTLVKLSESTSPQQGDKIVDASSVEWEVIDVKVNLFGRVFHATCIQAVS